MKQVMIASGVILTMTMAAWASPSNKKTNIEVKETILIPGKELPPGKYVMKLADSASSRHIVQIFNESEDKVIATILAIPNSRLQPTGDTALAYWETPSGVPPALRSWFYPGDSYGQEFAYPKTVAERISKANSQTKVPWYEGSETAEYETSALRDTELHDYDESALPKTTETQSAASSGAAQSSSRSSESADSAASRSQSTTVPPSTATRDDSRSERDQVAATPRSSTAVETPARERNDQDNRLLAQNRSTPAPDPSRDNMPDSLPQTATPYGMLILGGVALIAFGRTRLTRRLMS